MSLDIFLDSSAPISTGTTATARIILSIPPGRPPLHIATLSAKLKCTGYVSFLLATTATKPRAGRVTSNRTFMHATKSIIKEEEKMVFGEGIYEFPIQLHVSRHWPASLSVKGQGGDVNVQLHLSISVRLAAQYEGENGNKNEDEDENENETENEGEKDLGNRNLVKKRIEIPIEEAYHLPDPRSIQRRNATAIYSFCGCLCTSFFELDFLEKLYRPGETIQVSLSVQNNYFRPVSDFTVALINIQKFSAQNQRKEERNTVVFTKNDSKIVAKDVVTMSLLVPEGVQPSTKNSAIAQNAYIIKATAKIGRKRIELIQPISIGLPKVISKEIDVEKVLMFCKENIKQTFPMTSFSYLE